MKKQTLAITMAAISPIAANATESTVNTNDNSSNFSEMISQSLVKTVVQNKLIQVVEDQFVIAAKMLSAADFDELMTSNENTVDADEEFVILGPVSRAEIAKEELRQSIEKGDFEQRINDDLIFGQLLELVDPKELINIEIKNAPFF